VKRLVFRLSSLGDVILSTSALAVENLSSSVDWVVSAEYASLLEGHPNINRVWVFDRKSGLKAWIELCRQLYAEGYDEMLDLHLSLRTRITRCLFAFWSIKCGRRYAWRSYSKQRCRLYVFYWLKGCLPRRLRPEPIVRRFALAAGGSGSERPSLRYLLSADPLPFSGDRYLCVMPGSLWPGKRWPVESFAQVLKDLRVKTVILGSKSDKESYELEERLRQLNCEFVSGTGKWDFRQLANVLSRSIGYFGGDTGLAHFAEAVGSRSFVVFGPTVPDMGFGPSRAESRAISAGIWCTPCGKDGRYCFRLERYKCLRMITPKTVTAALSEWINK
jgi:ADP-heptose:LPS heptosyltransferase